MQVRVNGDERELDDGVTVADVMSALGLPERGVAVAVDGLVVPRSRWSTTVEDGASIEVLTAVQGG